MNKRIVLASASPRRLELCRQLHIECLVHPVDIDETPRDDEASLHFVQRMARGKASNCAEHLDHTLLHLPALGADTIVELEGGILGKPRDAEHAFHILSRLSGSQHHVHTAVAIVYNGVLHECLSSSEVSFAALSTEQITHYIDTGEPMDKAGAYAIQGRAAAFISNLNGSYSGVMGLPLYETSKLLAECGFEV